MGYTPDNLFSIPEGEGITVMRCNEQGWARMIIWRLAIIELKAKRSKFESIDALKANPMKGSVKTFWSYKKFLKLNSPL